MRSCGYVEEEKYWNLLLIICELRMHCKARRRWRNLIVLRVSLTFRVLKFDVFERQVRIWEYFAICKQRRVTTIAFQLWEMQTKILSTPFLVCRALFVYSTHGKCEFNVSFNAHQPFFVSFVAFFCYLMRDGGFSHFFQPFYALS